MTQAEVCAEAVLLLKRLSSPGLFCYMPHLWTASHSSAELQLHPTSWHETLTSTASGLLHCDLLASRLVLELERAQLAQPHTLLLGGRAGALLTHLQPHIKATHTLVIHSTPTPVLLSHTRHILSPGCTRRVLLTNGQDTAWKASQSNLLLHANQHKTALRGCSENPSDVQATGSMTHPDDLLYYVTDLSPPVLHPQLLVVLQGNTRTYTSPDHPDILGHLVNK
jgi:hypothetical protein